MAEITLREYCEQIENVIAQGRYSEAVAHGKHILKQYPKHVTTYQLLGKAMLESGQAQYAADMFNRVLSVDPENLVAWVAMSEIHSQQDQINAATWYLERAFELATENEALEEELRRLYAQGEGDEVQRIQLTRGALARLYLKGGLLSRAISELRSLLNEQPERFDLAVTLAEALWHNDQRLEASEVCRETLDKLPDCLKANLILGEIWSVSGREEGQIYLQRAEALDPENQMAQELFGSTSPLPPREPTVTPLDVSAIQEEQPEWMAEIEGAPAEEPTAEEAVLFDISSALETQIEIPSWLEEVTEEEEEEAPAEEIVEAPPAEPLIEEVALEREAEEEVPDWLVGISEEAEAEHLEMEMAPEPEVTEEEPPEWLDFGPAEEEEEEELAQPTERIAEAEIEAEMEAEEAPIPWETEEEEKEVPDWMAGLDLEMAEAGEAPPDEVAALAGATTEAEGPPSAEEAALPDWMEGEGVPSGDEALAWLEQLAAGKEEELQAQAQVEAEARLAEIMGRPTLAEPAEPPPPEAEAPEEPAVAEAEVEVEIEAEMEAEVEMEAEAPPAAAEVPEWMQELRPPEAPAEPAEAEIAPPAEEEMEEAFGWVTFGEPEVVAAAEEAPPAEAPEAEAAIVAEEPPSPPEALPEEEAAEEEKEVVEEAIALEEPPSPPAEELAAVTESTPPLEEVPPERVEMEVEAPPVTEPTEPLAAEKEAPPHEEPIEPEMAPPPEKISPEAVVEAKPEEPEEEEEEEVEVVEPVAEAEEVPPEPSEPTPPESIDDKRAYLKEHPRDYDTWLALAQLLWQDAQYEEALKAYSKMIGSSKLLEQVIADLETYLEHRPDADVQRVLGDAYMKDGRLQEALNIYRRALETL